MFSHPIRLGLLLLGLGLSPTPVLLAQAPQSAVEAAEATEADVLTERVIKLYQQGEYATAIPLAKKVLQLYRQQLGPDAPQVVTALNNLALLYRVQGRYAESEPLFKESLSILRKSLPPSHPAIAQSLNNLAGLYESQGRYSEAEPLFKESLSILRKSLPPSHPDIATALNNLAGLYESQGRYSESEPLYKESLSIRRKSLPPSHPAIATALNNLAGLYESQGRYSESEPLYKESLSIKRKSLPPSHPSIAVSLNNLATLYRVQGRYSESEPLYKESLSVKRKSLPPSHPSIATALNNLASLYESQGRYSESEPLYKESLSIRRKSLPPSHPDIAQSLNNLAEFYRARGRYAESEPLYKESLSILRKSLPPSHPHIAVSLTNLASLYESQGRYSDAELLDKESLSIRRKLLPPSHPHIAQSLNNLAILYWSRQSISPALLTLQQGLEVEENNLAKNLDFGNEQQKRRYLSLFSGSVDWSISLHQQLAPDDLQAQQLALTTILRRKGRLLDVQGQSRRRLRQNLTPALQTKLDQLNQLQASLSGLTNQGLRTNNPADQDKYVQDRQNLIQQIDQLENDLSRASAELRREFNPVTIPQVQAQLPAQSVLLEFMVYTPFDPKAPRKEQWGAARYIVYVLTPQGQIHAQDLGPAADLDPIIESFRKDVADVSLSPAEVQTSAQKLYSQLLKPIQPYLQSAEHLLIAPDGPLNLIPFEALVDSQNQYLVQTHQLTYFSSGRDLLRLSDPIPETQEVLVMANPDYNHRSTQPPTQAPIARVCHSDCSSPGTFRTFSGL
ncbi:tetratricopeptide repeat protein [Acaryochloris sp. IP29b_bin.137]|uniref:CHAT domain-containing protein n=1 Tax=Acaryochloris sp. IP29b_bin.137 TaxID=2969217 RepID=UPI002630F90A|nr:tetratricopeptide repeat protein [Acaryochloris sp. IP29b_bin.137]